MDNLDDLKAIWHTAKTDSLPSSGEMLQMIKKFRGQKLRNKWLVIVISSMLSVLMVVILCTLPFKMLSTYLGGTLITAGCVLLAATTIKSLRRFYQLDNCSNLEFLAFIEQTRQNQNYYYKKTMVAIVLLCSVGWVFYTYEPVYKHPIWLYSTYTIMFIYLAVMWFVVRPRSIKKDAEKLNTLKQRLKDISNQLK